MMFDSLLGEFDCKLDAKGRLKFPSQLVEQLEQFQTARYVVHRGYEHHLTLYPDVVWDEKRKSLAQYNLDKKDERAAVRYFHRGASYLKMDASNRVLLPKKLTDWANINKEIVLFAYDGQIEIWDRAKYEEDVLKEPESFGELTEGIQASKEKEQ